jgi:uncharacterized membrane protein
LKSLSIKRLTITALVAAVYVALTLGLSAISFGSIQFRLAEIMNLMAFIDPMYGAGVILGCFISNLFSPLGLIDVVVGTLSTAAAVFAISHTKNLFVASLWPAIANIPVAVELTLIYHAPLWLNIVSIWIGELGVVSCIGFPLFKFLLSRGFFRTLQRNTWKK